MKKKAASLIISFFLFFLSVPQICFAEAGLLFKKQDNPEISCAAMKAVSLLDISKKVVKINYENVKDFFFAAYFGDCASQDIPKMRASAQKRLISFDTVIAWNSKNGDNGKYCGFHYSKFHDYRLRGSPPGNNNSNLAGKIYLLSLEALHKGSIPAGDITLKFNNI